MVFTHPEHFYKKDDKEPWPGYKATMSKLEKRSDTVTDVMEKGGWQWAEKLGRDCVAAVREANTETRKVRAELKLSETKLNQSEDRVRLLRLELLSHMKLTGLESKKFRLQSLSNAHHRHQSLKLLQRQAEMFLLRYRFKCLREYTSQNKHIVRTSFSNWQLLHRKNKDKKTYRQLIDLQGKLNSHSLVSRPSRMISSRCSSALYKSGQMSTLRESYTLLRCFCLSKRVTGKEASLRQLSSNRLRELEKTISQMTNSQRVRIKRVSHIIQRHLCKDVLRQYYCRLRCFVGNNKQTVGPSVLHNMNDSVETLMTDKNVPGPGSFAMAAVVDTPIGVDHQQTAGQQSIIDKLNYYKQTDVGVDLISHSVQESASANTTQGRASISSLVRTPEVIQIEGDFQKIQRELQFEISEVDGGRALLETQQQTQPQPISVDMQTSVTSFSQLINRNASTSVSSLLPQQEDMQTSLSDLLPELRKMSTNDVSTSISSLHPQNKDMQTSSSELKLATDTSDSNEVEKREMQTSSSELILPLEVKHVTGIDMDTSVSSLSEMFHRNAATSVSSITPQYQHAQTSPSTEIITAYETTIGRSALADSKLFLKYFFRWKLWKTRLASLSKKASILQIKTNHSTLRVFYKVIYNYSAIRILTKQKQKYITARERAAIAVGDKTSEMMLQKYFGKLQRWRARTNEVVEEATPEGGIQFQDPTTGNSISLSMNNRGVRYVVNGQTRPVIRSLELKFEAILTFPGVHPKRGITIPVDHIKSVDRLVSASETVSTSPSRFFKSLPSPVASVSGSPPRRQQSVAMSSAAMSRMTSRSPSMRQTTTSVGYYRHNSPWVPPPGNSSPPRSRRRKPF